MEKLVNKISKDYGIDIISYNRRSSGILICGGTGLMMSIMDQCPNLNYCIDFDQYRNHPKIESFLKICNSVFAPACYAGWFFVTDPQPLLKAATIDNILYLRGKGEDYKYNINELPVFIEKINNHPQLLDYERRIKEINYGGNVNFEE